MKKLLVLLLVGSSVSAMAAQKEYSTTFNNSVTVTNNTGYNVVLHGDNEANLTFNNGATYTAPAGTKVNYYASYTSGDLPSANISQSNIWVQLPGQSTWHGYWVFDANYLGFTPTNSAGATYIGPSGDEIYAGTAGAQQEFYYTEQSPNNYVLTNTPQ